jgi:1-deoxy-D-xylulose-5-phosphate reductoisomerase
MPKKRILLLGSTGSIGTAACRCIQRFPDHFELVGLSANNSIDRLIEQAAAFGVRSVCVGSERSVDKVKARVAGHTHVFHGPDGLTRLVDTLDFDILLNALVGSVGLCSTVAALKRGKRVALANKESLVVGGDYITRLLDAGLGEIVPVDSEHSAIAQCLCGQNAAAIESIILTASGGPFRELPLDRFASITPEQALTHPTWSMGRKITIDSATLMNKGFEVIEAHHLFRLGYDKLRVCIHPQSIVHSMVEFHDGAVLAQMGVPDMELPIQYALSSPERLPMTGKRLKLSEIQTLSFFEPDYHRFPCLRLCLQAGQEGGAAPVVANAANEIAVEAFLKGRIGFGAIARIIQDALDHQKATKIDTLETILELDRGGRERARESIDRLSP